MEFILTIGIYAFLVVIVVAAYNFPIHEGDKIKAIKCILFHKKHWSCVQLAFDCCDDCECSKCGRKWTQ